MIALLTAATESLRTLKEPQFVLIIGDQHVFRVAVAVQHHFMILATKTRLLVASEGGMCRVRVIVIHPHSTSLYGSRHLVQLVRVSSPNS